MGMFKFLGLCLAVTFFCGCSSAGGENPGGAKAQSVGRAALQVGMPQQEAVDLLHKLGAEDFSMQMSVMIVREGSPDDPENFVASPPEPGELKEWMWSVPGCRVTLETVYKDGKVAAIHFWDQTRMKPVYHHAQPYERIQRIVFAGDNTTYDVQVIEAVRQNSTRASDE